jgi:hypothetical protein
MNLKIQIFSIISAFIIAFQPVLPYIEFITFKSYIEKNLCINRNKPCCRCHGKCFLKKQLAESNSQHDQKVPARSVYKLFDYNLQSKISGFFNLYNNFEYNKFKLITYRFNFTIDFFHPPQNILI